MLETYRDIVENMWRIANKLEEIGITRNIPFISKGCDMRLAMKAEVVNFLFVFSGTEKLPNNDQMKFMQHVLHVSVNETNRADYVNRARDYNVFTINPLMPYIISVDIAKGSNMSEIYLQFLNAMTMGYLTAGGEIDVGMLTRYNAVMRKNKKLIEKALQKTVSFDVLDGVEADKKELIDSICVLNENSKEDAVFNSVMKSIEAALKR